MIYLYVVIGLSIVCSIAAGGLAVEFDKVKVIQKSAKKIGEK